jgi:uncharacterized membrane protein
MWLLRTLMLLALVVWIGGIIFFAFVMAPTLFTVLPTTKLAGDVVSPTLSKLHWMGLISGAIFLLCSLLYNWRKYAQLRLFTATHVLIVLMLALTAISQFVITPAIRKSRVQAVLTLHPLTPDEIHQIQTGMQEKFQRLHAWSTRTEGAVLVLGVGVIVLTARRFS